MVLHKILIMKSKWVISATQALFWFTWKWPAVSKARNDWEADKASMHDKQIMASLRLPVETIWIQPAVYFRTKLGTKSYWSVQNCLWLLGSKIWGELICSPSLSITGCKNRKMSTCYLWLFCSVALDGQSLLRYRMRSLTYCTHEILWNYSNLKYATAYSKASPRPMPSHAKCALTVLWNHYCDRRCFTQVFEMDCQISPVFQRVGAHS